jgi:hypothetical protein
MTSAFGGQHSIQLSYGCGSEPYKENGRARQSAPLPRLFSRSGLICRQHRQILGQMGQGAVGIHMQGIGNFLDMLRRQCRPSHVNLKFAT